jgi:hypothetical protein
MFGYTVYVDIFTMQPDANKLDSESYTSADFSASLYPPFLALNANPQGSPPADSFKKLLIIYTPERDAAADQCLVDYYGRSMLGEENTDPEPSKASIRGLPDLCSSYLLIRLSKIPEVYGLKAPYSLQYIRMRVGTEEVKIAGADCKQIAPSKDFLIYEKQFPDNFKELLSLFQFLHLEHEGNSIAPN